MIKFLLVISLYCFSIWGCYLLLGDWLNAVFAGVICATGVWGLFDVMIWEQIN